jgi:hypothetical protein
MLEKPEFDCTKLGDFYDCGCADDEDESGGNDSDSGNKATPRESSDGGDTISPVEISREPSVHPLALLY